MTEDHVARRLHEIENWAGYVFESLTVDQKYEPGKARMLDEMFGREQMAKLREAAFALRDKLHTLAILADHAARPV